MRAPKKDILFQNELQIPKEFLRFATPAGVAEHRAERLKCNTIAEIGCGVGGQTIAFAGTCKKVIAIEIDGKQLEIAKENAKRLGLSNIEFIDGDALFADNIKKIKDIKPDIIFCDTERKESGERSIDDLKPDLRRLIEEYSKITDKIAIEVPPFTKDLERLQENFEKEFVSVDGKLNRLNLYFNKLKKAECSAVSLPSKAKIERRDVKKVEMADSALGFNYIYLIDPAVSLAGLVNELASEFKVKLIEMNKKEYFLSKEKISSAFLEGYKIAEICENDFDRIIEALKKIDAGKVVIRYSVLPADYWKERKKYEDKLKGEKKIHLFINKEAILAESMKY